MANELGYGDPLHLSTTAGDAAANSARLAAACAANTGKAIFITRPGTYYFSQTGAGYRTDSFGRAFRKCVDLGNIRLLRAAPGVIFRLADDQMQDSGDNRGPMSLFCSDSPTDMTIDGGFTIQGNTAGQTSWTGAYNTNKAKWNQLDAFQGITISSEAGAFGRVRIANIRVYDCFANSVVVEGDTGVIGGHCEFDEIVSEDCGEGVSAHDCHSAIATNITFISDADSYTASDASTKAKMAGDGLELARCRYAKVDGYRAWTRQGAVNYGGGGALDCGGSHDIDVQNVFVRFFQSGLGADTSQSLDPHTVRYRNIAVHECPQVGIQLEYPAIYDIEGIRTYDCGTPLYATWSSANPGGFVRMRNWMDRDSGVLMLLYGDVKINAEDCFYYGSGIGIQMIRSGTYLGTPTVIGRNFDLRSSASYAILVNGAGSAYSPTVTLTESRATGAAGQSLAQNSGTLDNVSVTSAGA